MRQILYHEYFKGKDGMWVGGRWEIKYKEFRIHRGSHDRREEKQKPQ